MESTCPLVRAGDGSGWTQSLDEPCIVCLLHLYQHFFAHANIINVQSQLLAVGVGKSHPAKCQAEVGATGQVTSSKYSCVAIAFCYRSRTCRCCKCTIRTAMSNPFEPPDGPPPEKGGGSTSAPASGSSSNPFEPPDSPPPPEKGSLAQGPPGIPGNRPGIPSSSSAAAAAPTGKGSAAAPVGVPDAMDVSIPDEPPPAYSSTPAQHTGESSVQAGPNRMDFSGPPPIPDRFQNQNYNAPQIEQHITGVGYGYRADPAAPQQGGYAPPPDAPPQKTNPFSGGNEKGSEKQPMNSQPTGTSSSGAGSSAPDLSPTEIATPGRPLLRKGQLLVYPKNHFCSKCKSPLPVPVQCEGRGTQGV